MTNQYDKIVNQYIEILLYDIDIKFYELKKNKINVEIADKIFDCYYENKMNEFKKNLKLAKKYLYLIMMLNQSHLHFVVLKINHLLQVHKYLEIFVF